jgi:hypothetical protein
MSGEDSALLKRAAEVLWPDAILSNSGIILGLAKITAKNVVGEGRKTARRKRGDQK